MITIRELDQRLERGWRLIEQAMSANDHDQEARLVEFWLAVEAEYRAACDALHWFDPAQHRVWRVAA